jgi:hypothetical protein
MTRDQHVVYVYIFKTISHFMYTRNFVAFKGKGEFSFFLTYFGVIMERWILKFVAAIRLFPYFVWRFQFRTSYVLAKGISRRTVRIDKAFSFKVYIFHLIFFIQRDISNATSWGIPWISLCLCYLPMRFQCSDYSASDGMVISECKLEMISREEVVG